MEVVSAAASIAGIVEITFQALHAIHWLQGFCEEYGTDRKEELLSDLATTGAILTSVKLLCEQVRESKVSKHMDLRTNALSIQVEDCAKDLQKWLRVAERLSARRGRGNPVMMVGRNLWSTFVDQASKSSRAKLYDRLHWHQRNIETTMAVFGRKFDVSNADRLYEVAEVTQAVHQKICDESVVVVAKLDSLSASNSSLLAHSRSTGERLKDVHTETSALSCGYARDKGDASRGPFIAFVLLLQSPRRVLAKPTD